MRTLNVVSSTVKGKRVVLVDDSIARHHLRPHHQAAVDAGAAEVHFRVSAPFNTPATFGDRLIPIRSCW